MSRRKQTANTNEEQDRDLIRHIHNLGLATVEDYREWCAQNGFSRKLRKGQKLRSRERSLVRERQLREKLDRKKKESRNLVGTITEICELRIGEHDVTQPHLRRLCGLLRPTGGHHFERQPDRRALLRILSHLLHCRARFFDSSQVISEHGAAAGNTYLEALATVSAFRRFWKRPVEDWKPRSHNARRQFASLLRHLFVEYEMPAFMDAVWFLDRTEQAAEMRRWYLAIARGQNIRNCKLPIHYTKKMAHHFMHAPRNVNLHQALRWGQILGIGGDERLARAIFATRLVENFDHDEFWITVIRWFVRHPLLDRTHVGPIVDYLHWQRFGQEIACVDGVRQLAPPLQPNLTMQGRTPESLLRRVNEWHRTLANDNTRQVRAWNPAGIAEFEFVEGSRKSDNQKRWTIRELLSNRSLIAEGRQLKHCVASYAATCARGHCSIWTMEVDSSEDGFRKLLTVEVRNHTRSICQARGKANRAPTGKELEVLRRWAAKSGLTLASYL